MGITKQQLKSIVKECLVEILSEGMGTAILESTNKVKNNKMMKQSLVTKTALEHQSVSKARVQSAQLREAIRLEAGGNDIMTSILTDTATKTLPAMLESDSMRAPRPSGKIENFVASHNPEDLFGEETASKWADLAFMNMTKK